MKHFIIFLFSFLVFSAGTLHAKGHDKNKLPKTEAELLDKILNCLQYEDTVTYATLFPDFDTVWKQVLAYPDTSADVVREMAHIRSHPEKVSQFDPYYNHDIVPDFYAVLKKGEDSGIHWNHIVLLRYELVKEKLTRDLIGYEKIAPFRFQGYVFIKDNLTRRVFCFTISEMQQIKGYWYGGRVLNLFEAATIDEYATKLSEEMRMQQMMKKLGLTESEAVAMLHKKSAIKTDENGDDDDDKAKDIDNGLIKKEIVDRKLYKGTFDNEIPITLYIRYMKGGCPEGICSWEAIYKFGDQDEYIKLDVSKNEEGKWVFIEDPPLGSMELTLKDKIYTGSWASTDNQTGYDVRLMETLLTTKKLKELDDLMEHKEWAKSVKKEKDDTHNGIEVDESYEQPR